MHIPNTWEVCAAQQLRALPRVGPITETNLNQQPAELQI
jgi:hypothetical protein